LLMTKNITLLQAMSGIDFSIDFLDGTKFRVKTELGQVIKPDQILTIEEKGMPFHKNSFKFGNLFILFKVKFPEQLVGEEMEQVKNCLKNLDGQQEGAD